MRLRKVSRMKMSVRLSVHVLCSSDIYTDMIIDNDPSIERHISVPRDMSQLSCSSFTAGIVEAILDGLGFVRLPITPPPKNSHFPDLILQKQPARVTAHNTPVQGYPSRTTILIKLEKSVLEREEVFKS
jgi:hypothetical protein